MLEFFASETWNCDDARLPATADIHRSKPDKGFVDTMARGQINPITIRVNKKDEYFLEAGRRRLLAIRQLKEEGRTDGKVAVRIFKAEEADGDWVTLVENAQITSNPVSDYMSVKRILLHDSMNYADIAKSIGMPVTYVKNLDQNFARVPDWALNAILKDKMVPSVAKELGKLSDKLIEECRVEMSQSKKGKLTMDMVKQKHRLVQNEATAQAMSFSGPQSNLRRLFTRDEIAKAYDMLVSLEPYKVAVEQTRIYLQELLAQEE